MRNREMKNCGKSKKIKINSHKQNKVVLKKKQKNTSTTNNNKTTLSSQLKHNTSDNAKAPSCSLKGWTVWCQTTTASFHFYRNKSLTRCCIKRTVTRCRHLVDSKEGVWTVNTWPWANLKSTWGGNTQLHLSIYLWISCDAFYCLKG